MVLYQSPPQSFEGFNGDIDNLETFKQFYKHQGHYQQYLNPTSYYPSPSNSMGFGRVDVVPHLDINGADKIEGVNGGMNGSMNGSSINGSVINSISSVNSINSINTNINTNINTASTTTTTSTTPSTSPSSSSKKNKSIYYNNVANIVCLLWFNDINLLLKTLNQAQSTNSYSNCKSREFSAHSIPTSSFKQFIANVITRTQLPPTALSLALLYILRLKKFAPVSIVGSANSEYRVFSVALILTNKYLDDNTYTNKTWSDITRLPLKELSAMEIEFLGNMRYSLHVEQNEWRSWQRQLKVWLNIHYWVCDYINRGNNNTTSNNNSPIMSSSSTMTSPISMPPIAKSNLSYLSLVSPPLRGMTNLPTVPAISINEHAPMQATRTQAQLPRAYTQPPQAQPQAQTQAHQIQIQTQPQPPLRFNNITPSLPTPPPMMNPLNLPTYPINTNTNHIITPPPSRKRAFQENQTPTPEYPPIKRHQQNINNLYATTSTHAVPTLRTLINTNMPQPPPPPPPQPQQQQQIPLQQAPPIYYIISQKKTFSPHYGYPQSTYLLPQQYQFELQHYIPNNVPPPPTTNFRPVQFLSPTTNNTNNNVYWRTPTYHSNNHFSSPPTHY